MKKLSLVLVTIGLFSLSLYAVFLSGSARFAGDASVAASLVPADLSRLAYAGLQGQIASLFSAALGALTSVFGGHILWAIVTLALLAELILLYPSVRIQLKQKKIHLFHKKLVDGYRLGAFSFHQTDGELEKLYAVNEKIHSLGAWFVAAQAALLLFVFWGLNLMVQAPALLPGSWSVLNVSLLSKPAHFLAPVLVALLYFFHALVKLHFKQKEDYISPDQIVFALLFAFAGSLVIYFFSGAFAMALSVYLATLLAFSTVRIITVEAHAKQWGALAEKQLADLMRETPAARDRFEFISHRWNHFPVVRYINFHLLEEAVSMTLGLLLALNFFGVFQTPAEAMALDASTGDTIEFNCGDGITYPSGRTPGFFYPGETLNFNFWSYTNPDSLSITFPGSDSAIFSRWNTDPAHLDYNHWNGSLNIPVTLFPSYQTNSQSYGLRIMEPNGAGGVIDEASCSVVIQPRPAITFSDAICPNPMPPFYLNSAAATYQFTATRNDLQESIRFSLAPTSGAGSIDTNTGLYTLPANPVSGTVTVTAYDDVDSRISTSCAFRVYAVPFQAACLWSDTENYLYQNQNYPITIAGGSGSYELIFNQGQADERSVNASGNYSYSPDANDRTVTVGDRSTNDTVTCAPYTVFPEPFAAQCPTGGVSDPVYLDTDSRLTGTPKAFRDKTITGGDPSGYAANSSVTGPGTLAFNWTNRYIYTPAVGDTMVTLGDGSDPAHSPISCLVTVFQKSFQPIGGCPTALYLDETPRLTFDGGSGNYRITIYKGAVSRPGAPAPINATFYDYVPQVGDTRISVYDGYVTQQCSGLTVTDFGFTDCPTTDPANPEDIGGRDAFVFHAAGSRAAGTTPGTYTFGLAAGSPGTLAPSGDTVSYTPPADWNFGNPVTINVAAAGGFPENSCTFKLVPQCKGIGFYNGNESLGPTKDVFGRMLYRVKVKNLFNETVINETAPNTAALAALNSIVPTDPDSIIAFSEVKTPADGSEPYLELTFKDNQTVGETATITVADPIVSHSPGGSACQDTLTFTYAGDGVKRQTPKNVHIGATGF